MPKRRNSMTRLFADAMKMGFDANQVIATRLMRMATGAVDSKRESKLMVTEKLEAAAEATMAAATSIATGQPHRAPGRALSAYNKRVKRNLRRLTKS